MGTERSGAAATTMMVGMNYPHPWNIYGVYFGGGIPPGSQPLMNNWTVNLKTNLIKLRDELNMKVVRIFLMCNGFGYGSATPGTVKQPPDVPGPMLTHLQQMLQAFQDTNMLVIPSIIDFKAFGRFKILAPAVFEPSERGTVPPKLVSPQRDNACGDREAIINDDKEREFFLETVVRKMCDAAVPFKDNVYAMEVMNEPRWNIGATFNPDHIAGGPTVDESAMVKFLNGALQIMKDRGLRCTVGHRFVEDLDTLPTGDRPQFHYYPLSPRTIPGTNIQIPKSFDPVLKDRVLELADITGAFLGEFGTNVANGELWPELAGADNGTTRTRVLERLKHIKTKRFPVALLWPDIDGKTFNPGLPGGGPDPIHLSQDAQDAVKDFMKLP
jgi:hypothetical protein